ncbi:hypothetical protein C9374_014514 [Naegleria lovaniensis]|uniref:Uncharacterized protein n=1 Tax=Naegleria lovaniensis TaxID=51637 RepID=A0AA88H044_NAELO|nr:uncharacterized protein C9374_014514 [Naegleria lovaniensis]KAG2389114.1 hypothetical protein C9374_014514 [Naegleria lovaniensis]
MFSSVTQSRLLNTLKGVSNEFAYSPVNHLGQPVTSPTTSFFSDFFGITVPGLTRGNQIVTAVIGVFLGVWVTFLTGTILIQLLFYKLFAVLFGLMMIILSAIFIVNIAHVPYDEATAVKKLVAFIIFGLCIFCGLLCIFSYGTDWTENAKSIVIIRQENFSTKTKSTLAVGTQWKVLWTFLIGISIYFLIIYTCAEIVTNGIFQCKCFSYLWYRRPACNYVYFMAATLLCSVIISSALSLFISMQKDSNVSIDSLISDTNPSYISLSNMLYGMLMLRQLAIVIPFGMIFGIVISLVFQYNYLKDWVDYQNYRNEATKNGGGTLIKASSLDLSDDDEEDDAADLERQPKHQLGTSRDLMTNENEQQQQPSTESTI